MSLEVKRQEGESLQSLIRRFSRRMQQSGILIRARKHRYQKKPKSNGAKKRAALRREELRIEYARLKKLGALKER